MLKLFSFISLLGLLIISPVIAQQANPRATWGNYSLQTNYYETIPDTGVTRYYYFDIVNTTAAPDGRERSVLLVNGQFPGPTIIADWGDTVVVNVRNSMQNNGSSIHFHGVRQFHTNQNDGVPSLTQCPIAPGENYTYTWRAEAYGSSWYHSHFSLQAWEGVFGGIVINGPASADYDEDLGTMFINDWSVETVDGMYPAQIVATFTPQADGGLLNGTSSYDFGNGTVVGEDLQLDFVPGKKYRVRLINAAIHSMYKFSIDNHNMTVIGTDFVAVEPFTTNFLSINGGQRYDVIIEAGQPVNNYWMRAVPQGACSNNTKADTRGIISYSGAPDSAPTTVAQKYADDFWCWDMQLYGFDMVPVLALDAQISTATFAQKSVNVDLTGPDNPQLGLWTVGESFFAVRWDDPTLVEATSVPDPHWTSTQNVFEVSEPNRWTVMVIDTQFPLAHPIHLHGHDFWVLATGLGNYTTDVKLNTVNPLRRDTVTMSNYAGGGGYVVIAWPADNPGVWLLHCHIGYHATEGFGLQVLERKAEIPALVDQTVLTDTCAKWHEYAEDDSYGVQRTAYSGAWDSGI